MMKKILNKLEKNFLVVRRDECGSSLQ
jgi:hypothetical protein